MSAKLRDKFIIYLPHRAPEHVYVVQAGTEMGNVKIGRSSNPWERMRQLQVGSALRLSMIVCFPGDSKVEAWLHRECSDDRLEGEWFASTEHLYTTVVDAFDEAAKNCFRFLFPEASE